MMTLSELNYDYKHDNPVSSLIIRRIDYIFQDNRLDTWLQYPSLLYRKLNLTIGDNVTITQGEQICPKCHQSSFSLEHGLCQRCIDPEEPFRIRLECLFRKPTSYLIQHGNCSKKKPPCGLDKNTQYCHSAHILYIGAIGNKIKIGISRKNRRGGYEQRLFEQGLSQAIVINDFSSRIDAMQAENWLTELGFHSRIHFAEKIELMRQDPIPLDQVFTQNQLEERFPTKQIEFYDIHQSLDFPDLESQLPPIDGEIKAIRGPVVVVFDGSYKAYDTRKLVNREVRSLVINEEVIV